MAQPFSIVAAAFTPFDPDGSVAVDVIERQLAGLLNDGADGAFVCGTTGEGAALSTPERKQVAEAWIGAAPDGFEIIVHVGHAAIADAADLARHAANAGAIAAVAPISSSPGRPSKQRTASRRSRKRRRIFPSTITISPW